MKKLVIKVVLITLACIVATVAAVYALLFFAAPDALASVFGNAGGYEKAVGYELKAYENKGDIGFAVAASDYALKSGKDELIIKAVGKFVADDEYAEYSANNREHTMLLTSKYIVAKYAANCDGVVDEAFSLLVGYDSHNQVESLIVAAYEKGDKVTLTAISARLDELDTTAFTEDQLTVLHNDKVIIQKALN